MPKVLFVAAQDPSADLGATVLFRSSVERVTTDDPERAIPLAKAKLPNLILIKDQLPQACEKLIRQLKEAPETRRASVVVVLQGNANGAELPLRRAGASLVLTAPVDPLLWDDRLEELLSEPRRREIRLPMSYVIWPGAKDGRRDAVAVNLSVRGMLLETDTPLEPGATLEVTFEVPDGPSPIEVVGQVVRTAGAHHDRRRYGVDFIILRGPARSAIEAFVESEARP
jgi:CheY-like chemotaxis protein